MGTFAQCLHLIEKLKLQPLGLKEVARKIEQVLTQFNQDKLLISWDGYRLKFHQKTLIMGILNLTPDSFSDGGKFLKKEDALRHAQEMEKEGADIIDVGGESTRPGARTVSLKEELRRVIPLIRELRKKIRIPISIDTRKAKVAKEAIENGANIINDVSALRYDPDMFRVAKKYRVPIIIMHMKGTPRSMQNSPQYRDVISEIYAFFEKTIQKMVQEGIDENKIIIDPGIGFGKTLEHNLQILRRLREFKSLGRPILVGPSRKSFIGQILNLPVDRRLNGTLASCACAIMNGADILRVHDVREVVELTKVVDKLVR
jgi:dihydropteroate synthase